MAKQRKGSRLKPRGAGQYSNKTHAKGDSSMPPDDRSLKTNLARVTLVRPKFTGGPLWFRPWPCPDFADPEKLVPGRESTEARGQSQWIVRAEMAPYIGLNDPACEKVSFITRYPWDREAKRNNPYRVLYFAAKDAHEAGSFGPGRKWDSYWNKILSGKKGRGAELGSPSPKWFVQGVVYANGEKDYTADRDLPLGMDPADDLVVIQMSSSAGGKLLDLLDIPKKNFDGDPEETPWAAYKYGDSCGIVNPKTGGIDGGLIMGLFNPEKTKDIVKNTSWDPDEKDRDIKGYEAAIRASFKGADGDVYKPSLDAAQVQHIGEKIQFWWDDVDEAGNIQSPGLLWVPSIEEQCVLIAKAFRTVPRLLQYAWADFEDEFLTDDVRGVLNARKSAVMPGTDGDEDDDDDDGFEDKKPPKRGGAKQDPTQASQDDDDDDEFEDEGEEESEAEAEGDEGEEEGDDDGDDTFPDDTVDDGEGEEEPESEDGDDEGLEDDDDEDFGEDDEDFGEDAGEEEGEEEPEGDDSDDSEDEDGEEEEDSEKAMRASLDAAKARQAKRATKAAPAKKSTSKKTTAKKTGSKKATSKKTTKKTSAKKTKAKG